MRLKLIKGAKEDPRKTALRFLPGEISGEAGFKQGRPFEEISELDMAEVSAIADAIPRNMPAQSTDAYFCPVAHFTCFGKKGIVQVDTNIIRSKSGQASLYLCGDIYLPRQPKQMKTANLERQGYKFHQNCPSPMYTNWRKKIDWLTLNGIPVFIELVVPSPTMPSLEAMTRSVQSDRDLTKKILQFCQANAAEIASVAPDVVDIKTLESEAKKQMGEPQRYWIKLNGPENEDLDFFALLTTQPELIPILLENIRRAGIAFMEDIQESQSEPPSPQEQTGYILAGDSQPPGYGCYRTEAFFNFLSAP